jgi:hypothetical protein
MPSWLGQGQFYLYFFTNRENTRHYLTLATFIYTALYLRIEPPPDSHNIESWRVNIDDMGLPITFYGTKEHYKNTIKKGNASVSQLYFPTQNSQIF